MVTGTVVAGTLVTGTLVTGTLVTGTLVTGSGGRGRLRSGFRSDRTNQQAAIPGHLPLL